MLTDKQDAFGHMVFDHLTKEPANQIVERDDGLVEIDNGVVYFSEFQAWPSCEKRAMRYVRGMVLDIGAGAGRCALYLQDRGHKVVCIDNSPMALEVCRLRGVTNTKLVPFSGISPRLGVFDTVIMMGNNFGLFGSLEGARESLQRLSKITSSRGRIVAETTDVYQTDVPEHLSYQKRNRRRGRMSGQIRLRARYRTYATPWFDYLMVSKEEMIDILDSTDWKITKFIDCASPMYVAIIDKR
jgi:SAM-dependent methyltransferase